MISQLFILSPRGDTIIKAGLPGVPAWSYGPYRLASTARVDHSPCEGCRHSRGCQIGYMGHTARHMKK
jgi:hypothetical protein